MAFNHVGWCACPVGDCWCGVPPPKKYTVDYLYKGYYVTRSSSVARVDRKRSGLWYGRGYNRYDKKWEDCGWIRCWKQGGQDTYSIWPGKKHWGGGQIHEGSDLVSGPFKSWIEAAGAANAQEAAYRKAIYND